MTKYQVKRDLKYCDKVKDDLLHRSSDWEKALNSGKIHLFPAKFFLNFTLR